MTLYLLSGQAQLTTDTENIVNLNFSQSSVTVLSSMFKVLMERAQVSSGIAWIFTRIFIPSIETILIGMSLLVIFTVFMIFFRHGDECKKNA